MRHGARRGSGRRTPDRSPPSCATSTSASSRWLDDRGPRRRQQAAGHRVADQRAHGRRAQPVGAPPDPGPPPARSSRPEMARNPSSPSSPPRPRRSQPRQRRATRGTASERRTGIYSGHRVRPLRQWDSKTSRTQPSGAAADHRPLRFSRDRPSAAGVGNLWAGCGRARRGSAMGPGLRHLTGHLRAVCRGRRQRAGDPCSAVARAWLCACSPAAGGRSVLRPGFGIVGCLRRAAGGMLPVGVAREALDQDPNGAHECVEGIRTARLPVDTGGEASQVDCPGAVLDLGAFGRGAAARVASSSRLPNGWQDRFRRSTSCLAITGTVCSGARPCI